MIIITGRAKIAPANRAAFIATAETQVTNSRREAGCVSYGFFEDAMEPGAFLFYEEWADQAAVDFHFSQDYCADFMARVAELTSTPPEINIHRVAEG